MLDGRCGVGSSWRGRLGLLRGRAPGCSQAASVAVVFMMVSNSMRDVTARVGLSSTPVVGPFDPGDDRDAELLAGGPRVVLEDAFPQ